jgi:hypothetical protein
VVDQVDEMRQRMRVLEAEQQAMDEMGLSAGPSIDARLAAGDWVDPARGRVTIAEWSAAWLSQVEALGKIRATTLARLRVSIREQVLPAFGSHHLSTLTAHDVQSWVVRMKGDGLSASTIRKAVFGLRGMLKAAILDQRLSHNVTKDVELPPESHYRKEPVGADGGASPQAR